MKKSHISVIQKLKNQNKQIPLKANKEEYTIGDKAEP